MVFVGTITFLFSPAVSRVILFSSTGIAAERLSVEFYLQQKARADQQLGKMVRGRHMVVLSGRNLQVC